MTSADDLWAAARQLGEQIAAKRAADRQATKDARNARRRQRYAATPKAARRTTATAVQVDDDYEVEPGCRCHLVPMPPCGWCENGGPDQEGDHQ
ncbi:hypothetical protein O7626_40505 [Micromonospora sp. WMMD1102]|uniref:hypothetical protein n=1 Tax=Micromonospora sp. WMMD1102 TaxID=3016105 RepID=UPI0024157DF2|nr:hypothetical protein [Micromonospora sp. WMMD1102]MDG4792099.1 hypothetical protein [Micromonospora sp. WMMD1102]